MLTKQDYDVLIEAVEAWESKPQSSVMLGDVISAMMCRNELEMEKMRAERAKHTAKLEVDKKIRSERSIMLRAKLIQLRDRLEAQAMIEEATR